jgi:Mechanosensitive ion channel
MDDAFRVGEYIQSGNYKGTVEGFSIRSVKLRHHLGPVYTVPNLPLLGQPSSIRYQTMINSRTPKRLWSAFIFINQAEFFGRESASLMS